MAISSKAVDCVDDVITTIYSDSSKVKRLTDEICPLA